MQEKPIRAYQAVLDAQGNKIFNGESDARNICHRCRRTATVDPNAAKSASAIGTYRQRQPSPRN